MNNSKRQDGILKATELFRPVVRSMAASDHQFYIETHAGSAASCIGRKPCAHRSIALTAPGEYTHLKPLIEDLSRGVSVLNDDPVVFLEQFNWSVLEARRALIFSALPSSMVIDSLVPLLSIYRMLSRRDNIDIMVTSTAPSDLHDDLLGDWESQEFVIDSGLTFKLWTNFDVSASVVVREPVHPNLSSRAKRIASCLMKLPRNEQNAVATAVFGKAKPC